MGTVACSRTALWRSFTWAGRPEKNCRDLSKSAWPTTFTCGRSAPQATDVAALAAFSVSSAAMSVGLCAAACDCAAASLGGTDGTGGRVSRLPGKWPTTLAYAVRLATSWASAPVSVVCPRLRRGLRLGDVGARDLADFEAIVRSLEFALQNLDVVLRELDRRRIADDVEILGNGVEERLLLGGRQRGTAGANIGFRLFGPEEGLAAMGTEAE